jgi:hypothetical protein
MLDDCSGDARALMIDPRRTEVTDAMVACSVV